MGSERGTETGLGHLGLGQLESEDLGDVKNALIMNSFFDKIQNIHKNLKGFDVLF